MNMHALLVLEQRWDDRLGGVATRGLREIFCYTAARLVLNGISLEDLFVYVSECLALTEHDPAPGGDA